MADLMKAVTTFALLKKKYLDFHAPSISISVDGKDLNEKLSAGIDRATIELTTEYQSSGCIFYVEGAYEEKETSFQKKLSDKVIQLGSKVEIKVGYVKSEIVFKGYISAIKYCFNADEGSPYIRVECMDVKGLLMKNQQLKIMKEDTIKQAVSKILSQQPYSSLISSKDIEDSKFKKLVITAKSESDYEFIVREAKRTGYEFFAINNKVYFRDEPRMGTPIMEVSPDKGILSAEISLDSMALVDKVTVRSVDPVKNTAIEGTANMSGKFGQTSDVKKIVKMTNKIYYEPAVLTLDDAKKRASIIIEQHAKRFGTIQCTCVGLPEIVPGRFINVDGLLPVGDKKYYISNVKHEISDEGFFTNFEARIKSL